MLNFQTAKVASKSTERSVLDLLIMASHEQSLNQTNFYTLDEKYIESLTDEKIDKLLAECKSEEREKEPVEERWKCAFLEWSGSRKHPKATELVEEGIVKGQWFFRKDGSKKKTSANGFRFIEKVSV